MDPQLICGTCKRVYRITDPKAVGPHLCQECTGTPLLSPVALFQFCQHPEAQQDLVQDLLKTLQSSIWATLKEAT